MPRIESRELKLLILPGDGIGPEVVEQTERVLEWFKAKREIAYTSRQGLYGLYSYRKYGEVLTEETLADILDADLVVYGASGVPEIDFLPKEVRHRGSLLRIRRELGVFANLRPVKPMAALADASTLRPEVIKDVDLIILRELNGGIYFGEPRGIDTLPDGQRHGYDTETYTTSEIRRVGTVAFELARQRRGKVCSVDKANVMESGVLWREEMQALHDTEFPDVELDHLFVDNCAMQLIRNPRQFDIIVTGNIFGDILSDCAAMLTGSLGMLPSASLGAPDADGRRRALYEPIHGSAPDIAGQGIANPLASILSLAMALRHSFERDADADLLETAVQNVVAAGVRTSDIAGLYKPVSTAAMGDAVLRELDALSETQPSAGAATATS